MSNLTQQHRQVSDALAHAIVENSPNGIVTIDSTGIIQSFSPKAEEISGYSAKEIIGKNINMLMPEPYRSEHDAYIQHYQRTGLPHIICQPGRELPLLTKQGLSTPIELMVAEMQVNGEKHFLGFIHDISQRKKLEAELSFAATHDQTGLINHNQLVLHLNDAIARDEPFLLFYLGLEHLESINEVLGHGTGDQVLAKVGKRLVSVSPPDAFIAHIGGSIFTVLWPIRTNSVNTLDRAQAIHDCLSLPLKLNDLSVDAEATIGVVSCPKQSVCAVDLLRYGQVAMQAARKRQVPSTEYDSEMEILQVEHLTLACELKHAIDAGELVVYYQPKIDIPQAKIVGMEALVRWIHPEKGMIPPDLFIPMAEETGIIHPFTDWLLNEVSKQMGKWQDKGIELIVAINLAPRNLLEADLPERLQHAITRWNIKPSNFMMEITERGLVTDPQRTRETLERIHALGMPVSIDDFGTGYSSLTYLKDFPISELKIDKSFITAMGENANSLTIVQTVVQMSHFLGIEVIAEGVEFAQEWKRLEFMGCDKAQGYFMAKPMPADALEHWMLESPWARGNDEETPLASP